MMTIFHRIGFWLLVFTLLQNSADAQYRVMKTPEFHERDHYFDLDLNFASMSGGYFRRINEKILIGAGAEWGYSTNLPFTKIDENNVVFVVDIVSLKGVAKFSLNRLITLEEGIRASYSLLPITKKSKGGDDITGNIYSGIFFGEKNYSIGTRVIAAYGKRGQFYLSMTPVILRISIVIDHFFDKQRDP